MRKERFGGLNVRITGGSDRRGGGDGPVIILLHGFGAPGHDLVPLWEVIDAPVGTRFVFPEGPLSLDMGLFEARAWWMLDIENINREIAAGRARDLSAQVPDGLAEARDQLTALLQDIEQHLDARPEKTVLGGFSQGAMLACDVALRSDIPLAGLVLLSGTLLSKQEWVPLMAKRKGFSVLQSHGSMDPVLPPLLAEELRDLLTQAGVNIQWVGFEGAHEIPMAVIKQLGSFLNKVLSNHIPTSS